jgi:hypothetical protein
MNIIIKMRSTALNVYSDESRERLRLKETQYILSQKKALANNIDDEDIGPSFYVIEKEV